MTLEIQLDASLQSRNTFGLGVRAEHLVVVRSEEHVREALELARKRQWRVTVLGGGSNVVFQRDVQGLLMHVAIPGVVFTGNHVEAGAGESWHPLVCAALATGFSGLENLSLIPGSVGAAPIQNIGAYGVELDSVFDSLTAIHRDTGETLSFDRSTCEFGYRDSVFKGALRDQVVITRVRLKLSPTFDARLDYVELRQALEQTGRPVTADLVSETVCALRRRKLPDPVQVGNVGSFFKNPVVTQGQFTVLQAETPGLRYWSAPDGVKLSAAWLIEHCGLIGRRIGGAAVSEQHALVLVNLGGATSADVLALASLVQDTVNDRFNLALEIEPVLC